MTNHPDLFAALAAPFQKHETKHRKQAGREFSYVTARTVMNRLDEVLGPENWWFEPVGLTDSSVLGRLTVRLPDGSTVTKADLGGTAGMADAGDDDKSAASDALKRAAVLFGVGRHLYGDGVPRYHVPARAAGAVSPPPSPAPATLGWVHGDGDRDRLPSQARPPSAPEPEPEPKRESARERLARACPLSTRDEKRHGWPPRNGRELFAWSKTEKARTGLDTPSWMVRFGQKHGHPARLVDWTNAQVVAAHAAWWAALKRREDSGAVDEHEHEHEPEEALS